MDKKRLLELAGVPLNENVAPRWGEGFADASNDDNYGDESDDTTVGDVEDSDSDGEDNSSVRNMLQNYITRAARQARREGMQKEEFDRTVLELTDEVWKQFQSVRKRGERVGGTPRF